MKVEIACICGRHDTDVVTLRDALDFRGATTIRNTLGIAKVEDPDVSNAEILAILREQYILEGVERWTLQNGTGPLPVSKANIRAHLLTHIEEATAVAQAADDLYSEQVVLPLLATASSSSPPSPTAASTSARTTGRRKRPTPSSRSSTETTQTDAIGTTTSPPDGDSN